VLATQRKRDAADSIGDPPVSQLLSPFCLVEPNWVATYTRLPPSAAGNDSSGTSPTI
jgi:hypothetical protein